MKARLVGKIQTGFSTFEVVIAMAIMIMVLTAVMVVSFGNQDALLDSQTSAEALAHAQQLLEYEQALARKDFNLVNPTPGIQLDATNFCPSGYLRMTDSNGIHDIYCAKVDVETHDQYTATQPDFFTKHLTITVVWTAGYGRDLKVQLSAVVTDFTAAVGGTTCDSVLSGDWTHPQIKNTITDFVTLVGLPGTYTVSDVNAYKGKLYVTVSKTANSTDPTFFIFDINKLVSDPLNALLGKVDNALATTDGLSAVAVAEDTLNGRTYAYVANKHAANFGTCINTSGTNTSCGQLQVIDVTPTLQVVPQPPMVKYTLKLPSVSGGTSGVGSSVFYSNGYVYLGLLSTSSHGPEFHAIDVHIPWNGSPSPSEVGYWPSSGSLNHDINAIYVKGQYAYLAHPADSTPEQLTVLDITNLSSPQRKSGFYSIGGIGGNGKSLASVGDSLYLGRTATNISGTPDTNPEFYALDGSDPTAISGIPLGTLPLLATSDSLNSLIVRDNLAFFATNRQLQVWQLDAKFTPWNIHPWVSLVLPASGSATEPSMDCEGNTLFISSNDSGGRGYLAEVGAL